MKRAGMPREYEERHGSDASPEHVLPPPGQRIHVLRWLRENLFSNWWNALLTVAAAALIGSILLGLTRWAISEAEWQVIPANLKLLLVGTYPVESLWRVWTCLYVIALLLGFSARLHRGLILRVAVTTGIASIALAFIPFSWATRGWIAGFAVAASAGFGLAALVGRGAWIRRIEAATWILSFPLVLILLNGVGSFLPVIEGRDTWGFLLNLLGAVLGIGLSLPIGILLALGRRSRLPAIRWICTAYIELIRGVPLITLLFMASIMLQLLLPDSIRPDLVVRAMVTITAFSAAYMAENVRGGLQAIPKGQYEAAYAVGLGGFLTTILIILPQALRAVIPAIVGQFIALFKDTTLFGFISILELLSVSRSVLGNLEWRGTIFELYVFIGLIFWVLCYSMSSISRRIERSLGVGER